MRSTLFALAAVAGLALAAPAANAQFRVGVYGGSPYAAPSYYGGYYPGGYYYGSTVVTPQAVAAPVVVPYTTGYVSPYSPYYTNYPGTNAGVFYNRGVYTRGYYRGY